MSYMERIPITRTDSKMNNVASQEKLKITEPAICFVFELQAGQTWNNSDI